MRGNILWKTLAIFKSSIYVFPIFILLFAISGCINEEEKVGATKVSAKYFPSDQEIRIEVTADAGDDMSVIAVNIPGKNDFSSNIREHLEDLDGINWRLERGKNGFGGAIKKAGDMLELYAKLFGITGAIGDFIKLEGDVLVGIFALLGDKLNPVEPGNIVATALRGYATLWETLRLNVLRQTSLLHDKKTILLASGDKVTFTYKMKEGFKLRDGDKVTIACEYINYKKLLETKIEWCPIVNIKTGICHWESGTVKELLQKRAGLRDQLYGVLGPSISSSDLYEAIGTFDRLNENERIWVARGVAFKKGDGWCYTLASLLPGEIDSYKRQKDVIVVREGILGSLSEYKLSQSIGQEQGHLDKIIEGNFSLIEGNTVRYSFAISNPYENQLNYAVLIMEEDDDLDLRIYNETGELIGESNKPRGVPEEIIFIPTGEVCVEIEAQDIQGSSASYKLVVTKSAYVEPEAPSVLEPFQLHIPLTFPSNSPPFSTYQEVVYNLKATETGVYKLSLKKTITAQFLGLVDINEYTTTTDLYIYIAPFTDLVILDSKLADDSVKYLVGNQETEVANDFKVTLFVDGQETATDTISTLNGNQYMWREFPVSWSPTEGIHLLEIIVDSDDVVDETDENNNILTKQIEIAPTTGYIEATSEPSGADFYVDGDWKGQTPMTVEVPAGTHTVKFSKPGYTEKEESVTVVGGEISTIHCDFQQVSVFHNVTVHVYDLVTGHMLSNAQVYMDGHLAGETDEEGEIKFDCPEGAHVFKATKEGYRETERNYTIKTDLMFAIDLLPETFTDDVSPTIEITLPENNFNTTADQIVVRGEASDNVKINKVEIKVNDGPFQPVNNEGTQVYPYLNWSATVDLTDRLNQITARAVDLAGNVRTSSIWVIKQLADSTDPVITVLYPSDGMHTPNWNITAYGTASDDSGVAKVEYRVNGGNWWRAQGTDNWRAHVVLTRDRNTVTFRATDLAGNTSTASVTIIHDTDIDATVDDDHGADFSSIQSAVDSARDKNDDGEIVIYVNDGNYYEYIRITDKEHLTLVAESKNVQIKGPGTRDVYVHDCSYIKINGFTFKEPQEKGYGVIIVESDHVTLSNCKIATTVQVDACYECVVNGNEFSKYIFVDEGQDLEVSGNTFTGGGIDLDLVTDSAVCSNDIRVNDWDGGYGVSLKKCSNIEVKNNNIRNATSGIEIYEDSNYINVSKNSINNCIGGVEVLLESSFNEISANSIKNCSTGISLSESEYNRIINNIIVGGKTYGWGSRDIHLRAGIDIESSNNEISGNSITKHRTGIQVEGERRHKCQSVLISENQISQCQGTGMELIDVNQAVIAKNNISNNQGQGINLAFVTYSTVTENTISNNQKPGISVHGSFLLRKS
ncbi:MAG: hypothetical protein B6U86_05700 [Candidatus Altiarchaeales archaeon ex4484_43]|nr:MAG: hypothetical protein B6U86_05700 [Candidatus Altiarchaeales archaeon ex4484_43]